MISHTFSNPIDFVALARRFHAPGVRAVALLGSHARGDAGPFSDVDIVRFLAPDVEVSGAGSHLVADRLVVVSNVTPADVDGWFTNPVAAVKTVAGLRAGRALRDDDGYFAAIQARAAAFVWTSALQAEADRFAGEQMVGLIEEVHKGLEGLRRNDVGRMLNARFGLSWLLSNLMQVQRGVLIEGDNGFFTAMTIAMGADSRWSQLYRRAYGVDDGDLRAAVTAGLHLYCECARLLEGNMPSTTASMVAITVQRIESELDGASRADFSAC